jgi:Ca2+-binding EF-hand superfamily protein
MRTFVFSLCALFCVASAMAEEAKPPRKEAPQRDLDKTFKRLDKNQDGKLSLEEFLRNREGDKAEQAKKQFARFDKNQDGFLSLEEFKTRAPARPATGDQPKKGQPDPERAFKRLDKNGDGKLTLEEFIGKREGDKAEQAKKQFARLDKDGNGTLSLEEFKARGRKQNASADAKP